MAALTGKTGPHGAPPRASRLPPPTPVPTPDRTRVPVPDRTPAPRPNPGSHPRPPTSPRSPPQPPAPGLRSPVSGPQLPSPPRCPAPAPAPASTSLPPEGPLPFPQENVRLALLGAQAEEPPPRLLRRRLLAFPGLLHRIHICRDSDPETSGRAAARGSAPWPPGLSASAAPPPASHPPGLAPAPRRTRNRPRRRRRCCQQTSRIPQLIRWAGPAAAIGWPTPPQSATARVAAHAHMGG